MCAFYAGPEMAEEAQRLTLGERMCAQGREQRLVKAREGVVGPVAVRGYGHVDEPDELDGLGEVRRRLGRETAETP